MIETHKEEIQDDKSLNNHDKNIQNQNIQQLQDDDNQKQTKDDISSRQLNQQYQQEQQEQQNEELDAKKITKEDQNQTNQNQENQDKTNVESPQEQIKCYQSFQNKIYDHILGEVRPCPCLRVSCYDFLNAMIIHDFCFIIIIVIFAIFLVTSFKGASLEFNNLYQQAMLISYILFGISSYFLIQIFIIAFHQYPLPIEIMRYIYSAVQLLIASFLFIFIIIYSLSINQSDLQSAQNSSIGISDKLKQQIADNKGLAITIGIVLIIYSLWHLFSCFLLGLSLNFLIGEDLKLLQKQIEKRKQNNLDINIVKKETELKVIDISENQNEVNNLQEDQVSNNESIRKWADEKIPALNNYFEKEKQHSARYDKIQNKTEQVKWERQQIKDEETGKTYKIIIPGFN